MSMDLTLTAQSEQTHTQDDAPSHHRSVSTVRGRVYGPAPIFVVANHITTSLATLTRHADGSVGVPVNLLELKGEIGLHRVVQPFAIRFRRSALMASALGRNRCCPP